jgi:acetolactate synthase-1/2/3 large subunit
VGLRAETPDELDGMIELMIDTPAPVIFDCRVERAENCLPMIPSGKAHNEMMLGDAVEPGPDTFDAVISDAGRGLV